MAKFARTKGTNESIYIEETNEDKNINTTDLHDNSEKIDLQDDILEDFFDF